MSPRAIVPRCPGHTRGPCSPQRARSKMGYPANPMLLTRGFRVGIGCYPDIAPPPGHRLTPARFHPLRKSSLCIANIFLSPPIFEISSNSEKSCICVHSALHERISTGRRPRKHPRALPVDAQGHSRHFHALPKKFSFSRKMRTGKFKKNHPVTNRIQRLPI